MLGDTHQSDTNGDKPGAGPSTMECTDEYDTEVGATFNSIAFSAFTPPGRDLSQFRVVDSACSINFTAFRSNFVSFKPPSGTYRVGSVGVALRGSGNVQITIPLVFGQTVRRIVHAMYTLDLSARFATQRIGRLLILS
jgi:hypothetical protein